MRLNYTQICLNINFVSKQSSLETFNNNERKSTVPNKGSDTTRKETDCGIKKKSKKK